MSEALASEKAIRDKLGQRGLRQPITNPYIAGVPVDPPLFRGREDIYRRIHQLWSGAQARKPPIILYGHRRMGKSSILRNLPAFLPQLPTLLVYLDMTGTALQTSDAELWTDIAAALARELGRASITVPLPPPEASFRANWRQAMDAYLINQVGPALPPGQRVALALDEFEAIEAAIKRDEITPQIIRYLRYLSQHNEMPWLTVILGGLHTLEEMTHDYWNPLFRSIETIKVGYMAPDVAEELLINPGPDFPLTYDREVIEAILDCTAGQPYLVQLCGQLVVEAWNNRFLDGRVEVAPRITIEDWHRALSLVFVRGGYYFEGVWGGFTAEEQALLRVIAAGRAEAGWSEPELAAETDMSIEMIEEVLKQAVRHDTLAQGEGGRWRFIVPLMREWVSTVVAVEA